MSQTQHTVELFAENLARYLHRDQRYGNQPYVVHLEAVVEQLRRRGWANAETLIVAWLHDAKEDQGIGNDTFLALGIPAHCVDAIDAISKQPGEATETYMARVARNPLAILVKIADSSANEAQCLADGDVKRADYYRKRREHLELILESGHDASEG